MIWAIVWASGKSVIRYDNPQGNDRASERRNAKVWQIDREPDAANGERVDYETGEIIFDLRLVDKRLVDDIKAEAARRILAIVPRWKQDNDLRLQIKLLRAGDPEDTAAKARGEAIDAVRDWSDALELELAGATSPAQIRAIRDTLAPS